jgi:type VI secretion system secreted protein Hcp
MAFDAFVKFTPAAGASEAITGESSDSSFLGKDGWFEIKEFSFGIENTLNITSASGGAGAGKAEFKEFSIKKQTDKASPLLASTCGRGGHYDMVELCLRKSGVSSTASGGVYLCYLFKTVAVKSVEWSGSSGDDVPEESVVFEYGALKIIYAPQKPDGTLDTAAKIERAWNKMSNDQNVDSAPTKGVG